ncbi:MAG: hypothetical protein Q8L47_01315 [bacterium]|nr:hypothetical protein [bacterium]
MMPIPLLELLEFHSFFREELEELLTSPTLRITGIAAEMTLNKLDAGEKLPKSFRLADDLLCRLGQDLRLTHDRVEELRLLFLE